MNQPAQPDGSHPDDTLAHGTHPDAVESTFVEITRPDVTWRFEREFLTSNWTCLFGNGCKGILTADATELNQGCCSLGAHFGDGPAGQEESRQVSAMAALLTPEQWQHHDAGTTDHLPDGAGEPVAGIHGDGDRTHTRVVDGACVFLNRPGFAGGEGCALHIAAAEFGDSPTEWKPSVCWQLPLRVDWALVDDTDPEGPETATVRRWSRADWGKHGETMHWCCTERSEGAEAYSGDNQVIESLRDELEALSDESVYDELNEALDEALKNET
ncbi:hypothetical protein [Ilumatobacter coccineus]|uniref:DUF3109 domain-containing protein n=1 Tax=Ilumatobacter coccineus (strain NBRC 103263 / KCTC 29153 / YM16-304) TaxID=1313172 RepID=A0A6C7E4S0_ILUCY|nr:hypothetical protein [Ilumatobacter coccineus]BAN00339.1 hypothetical protein YM304_00250 [Ilumatobacter coccineus YM16-304]